MAKVGNDIKASASGVDIAGATLIMNDMILTEGVVFAYSAYFRSDKPVRFQIWRPVVNETTNAYRLIGETRVIPSVKNDREDVSVRLNSIRFVHERHLKCLAPCQNITFYMHRKICIHVCNEWIIRHRQTTLAQETVW